MEPEDRLIRIGDELALVVELVADRAVGVLAHRVEREVRARHAHRVEERRAHVVFVRLAGQPPGEIAGGHVHEVVVLEPRADVFAERVVAESRVELLARER